MKHISKPELSNQKLSRTMTFDLPASAPTRMKRANSFRFKFGSPSKPTKPRIGKGSNGMEKHNHIELSTIDKDDTDTIIGLTPSPYTRPNSSGSPPVSNSVLRNITK